MRAPVQVLIASLLILALFMTSTAGICGGWESSPEAHRECCARAQHDCEGEKAGDCCAAGEERRHSESSGTSSAVTPPILAPSASTADSPVRRTWQIFDDWLDRNRASTDAWVLLCVFLI